MDKQGRDIFEVGFTIGGRELRMQAGEVRECLDGTLEIVEMDEAILVQVDGRRPGPPPDPSTASRIADS
jgi:hypothetical protein